MTKLRRAWSARAAYLLIAPLLALYGVFSLVPIAQTFVLSAYDTNIVTIGSFVGLDNYRRFLSDPAFQQGTLNTVILTVICAIATLVLAFALAVLLHSPSTRARTVFKVVYFLPAVTAGSAIAYVWKWMFDTKFGFVNAALGGFGVEGPRWLSDPHLALYSIAFVLTWASVGYFMVIFLAHLQALDPALYEVAAIDGAGAWQALRFITIPMMRRAISLVFVLELIFFMQAFVLVWVMTKGGPGRSTDVLTTVAYKAAFQSGFPQFGVAAAASVVLFLAILILTTVVNRRTNLLGVR